MRPTPPQSCANLRAERHGEKLILMRYSLISRLTGLLSLSLVMGGQAADQPTASQRPNILLIYADDLGYGDVGCNGATGVQTPNVAAQHPEIARRLAARLAQLREQGRSRP